MKNFTKDDLKNRMIVEYRNGERRMVIDDILLGDNDWCSLCQYSDDLICTSCRVGENCSDYDIMKVFSEIYSYNRMRTISIDNGDKLLWQRLEVKEVTMAEVEEKFGCKVKIVSDGRIV
jgi:hypothetical protein